MCYFLSVIYIAVMVSKAIARFINEFLEGTISDIN